MKALTLLIVAAYVTVGVTIPVPYLSVAVSAVLLAVGLVALWRYGGPALDIVVFDERGEDPGAVLAVYGMALLAAGSVYSGAYGLTWNATGQPETWVGSWYSAAGRALTASGFVLMVMAPEVSVPRLRLPGVLWLMLIMSAALVVAFVLGTQVVS